MVSGVPYPGNPWAPHRPCPCCRAEVDLEAWSCPSCGATLTPWSQTPEGRALDKETRLRRRLIEAIYDPDDLQPLELPPELAELTAEWIAEQPTITLVAVPPSQPLHAYADSTARQPRVQMHPAALDDLMEATTSAWRRCRSEPHIEDVVQEFQIMARNNPDLTPLSSSGRTLQRRLHDGLLGDGQPRTWRSWLDLWRKRRPAQ